MRARKRGHHRYGPSTPNEGVPVPCDARPGGRPLGVEGNGDAGVGAGVVLQPSGTHLLAAETEGQREDTTALPDPHDLGGVGGALTAARVGAGLTACLVAWTRHGTDPRCRA